MDVCFVVMPFGGVHRPALGVSLLKAELKRTKLTAKIHYFNVKFAEEIGLGLYDRIAENTELSGPSLIGELVFARIAFGQNPLPQRRFERTLRQIFRSELRLSTSKKLIDEVKHAQHSAQGFVNECASEILSEKPRLVGFTSTFHQNCASLAVARTIKERASVPIIFGGANCEAEMGSTLLRWAPWVDYVCSGEGDRSFSQFSTSFFNGGRPQKIHGIITKNSDPADVVLNNPVMEMDRLPFPDFDDYFVAVQQSSLRKQLPHRLSMETSRGCWWGERSQCAFCGLNGLTMKYRSKTVQRVMDELCHLIRKYGMRTFQVVDNILDLRHIDSLFRELHRRKIKADLFYETKSNISKKQLEMMRQGGVTAIQPGIESLSDAVLKIMKKGVSGLHNIQLLKWCRELDIDASWNLLWGFPGEPEREYDLMAETVPLLVHLQPPVGFGKIVLDRFSPYFERPLENGLINVRPSIAYNHVYPLPEEELRKMAYHFDFDYSDGRDPSTYTVGLRKQLVIWKKLWSGKHHPSLVKKRVENLTMIYDHRPSAAQRLHLLAPEEAEIYEICDTARAFTDIAIGVRKEYPHVTDQEVTAILSGLVDEKLTLYLSERYLSLAIPVE
jgi:ribosomal peptide maturation radical SAM protein 1